MAELNLTSAVPHTDCGTGRQRGRIGWLIAAGILAAALLGLLVLTLADLRRAVGFLGRRFGGSIGGCGLGFRIVSRSVRRDAAAGRE